MTEISLRPHLTDFKPIFLPAHSLPCPIPIQRRDTRPLKLPSQKDRQLTTCIVTVITEMVSQLS